MFTQLIANVDFVQLVFASIVVPTIILLAADIATAARVPFAAKA